MANRVKHVCCQDTVILVSNALLVSSWRKFTQQHHVHHSVERASEIISTYFTLLGAMQESLNMHEEKDKEYSDIYQVHSVRSFSSWSVLARPDIPYYLFWDLGFWLSALKSRCMKATEFMTWKWPCNSEDTRSCMWQTSQSSGNLSCKERCSWPGYQ